MNKTLPDRYGSLQWMPARGDLRLAYGLLRLTLGVNMLLHGLVRILGGVEVFAAGMTRQFAETMLPAALVQTFGTVLPFIELAIGVLLVFGAFTRATLVAGGALMIALVFGTALRSDWGTVGGQMLYALIFAVLLALVHADAYSVDALRRRLNHSG
jgi:thiosulfate dehydrogenase (quinone) large subunit